MVEGGLSLARQRGVQGGVLGTRTRPTPPPPVCLDSEAFCWKAERDRNDDTELRA